jgi:predicted permease
MSASPHGRTKLAERIYRILLFLYPTAVRQEDGEAMLELFSDLREGEGRRSGWSGTFMVTLRAVGEVPFGAWRAHGVERRARTAHGARGQKNSQAAGRKPRGGGSLGRPSSGASGVVGDFLQDLRFGLRMLRKTPLVVLVTTLSLGVGIGAVTSAYSLADGILLQDPVGFVDPEELVTIYTSRDDGGLYGSTSFPDYLTISQEIDALESATAFGSRGFVLEEGEASISLFAEEVDGNYFAVTGVRPVLGRGFLPEETERGAVERVLILGHHIWLQAFGGSPEVLGRTVRLNGQPFTVVGVGPEGAMSRRVPVKVDAWVPLGLPGSRSNRRVEALAERGTRPFLVLARMGEGVTVEQVGSQLSVLSERLSGEYSEAWTDDLDLPREFSVIPEEDSRLNPRARPLFLGILIFFFGTTGIILLIACANLTTLFLARAAKRRREMAIRLSLGAGRMRLVSQMLTESLILGLGGGGVGVFLTTLAVRQIQSFSLPLNLPFNPAVAVDNRVLAFACLLSLGATLVFGLIPALEASKPNLIPSLRGEAPGRAGSAKGRAFGRARGRNQLVVIQCAASLVLIVGAALFLRTLRQATTMDLGFRTEGVAVMSKSLMEEEYPPEAGIEYFRTMREHLRSLPGVSHAELSRSLELTFFNPGPEATVSGDGSRMQPGEEPRILRNSVTPGYLEMLQIPLLQGRTLRESDALGAPLVAVVNETFAERVWPGEDPVGRLFNITDVEGWSGADGGEPQWLTVVGVVENGTYQDFDDGRIPYFWTSLYQDYTSTVAVSLKGAMGAEAMLPLLQEFVELAPGEVPLLYPSTLESQVSVQFIHLRIASDLLGWGGLFGLILAVMGIYGTVSMAATERAREMAIRLALGAERGEVVRRVARGGAKLAVIGLVIGLGVGLPLAHLLRALFYGVGALDPLALGGGIALLALSALMASIIPAQRITRMDPMRVLKEE